MTFDIAMAAVAVRDLDAETDFYARLFGRPADARPMPSLAQWELDGGGLQVVEVPELAGSSMATLLTSDLDGTLAALADRGVDCGEVVTGVVSRLFAVTDPSGNRITVAEAPTG